MIESEKAEPVTQVFAWFSEGEFQVVEVGGIQITVKFVARKGRRARISIVAPSGAVFRSSDRETNY